MSKSVNLEKLQIRSLRKRQPSSTRHIMRKGGIEKSYNRKDKWKKRAGVDQHIKKKIHGQSDAMAQ